MSDRRERGLGVRRSAAATAAARRDDRAVLGGAGELGHALLAGLDGLGDARALVLSHHEYWDGSGCPEGRRQTQIPRAARVFVLVDSYEAIVRDDVGYRARRDHGAARDEIIELAGARYRPAGPRASPAP